MFMLKTSIAGLSLVTALGVAQPALAQVAGATTTVGVTVTESTRFAMGWSVKKTLMGKSVYNDSGQKIGKVEDLIISPDKSVSSVIVGPGGFVGIGRHDVAVPVTQIQDQSRKLADMKTATANRWKEFEAGVSAATARVRKSIQTAIG